MEIFSPFRKFAEFVQSRFWSTDATLQKHNLKSCAVVSLSKRTNISLYVMSCGIYLLLVVYNFLMIAQ